MLLATDYDAFVAYRSFEGIRGGRMLSLLLPWPVAEPYDPSLPSSNNLYPSLGSLVVCFNTTCLWLLLSNRDMVDIASQRP